MPENGGADRACHKADGIDGKGLKRADPGIGMREKQLGEDEAGDGAVEEEIVPLDRGADRGRDHGAAELDLMFGCGERSDVDPKGCHGCFLPNRHFQAEEAFPWEREAAAKVPGPGTDFLEGRGPMAFRRQQRGRIQALRPSELAQAARFFANPAAHSANA